MITYEGSNFHPGFVFQTRGSVMPFACLVALPCALISVGLKLLALHYINGEHWTLVGLDAGSSQVANAAFSGFSFLIGFLVVFRASQAYTRFWEGCSAVSEMQGEWFDSGSSLVAFSRGSIGDKVDIKKFQHTLVRLLSMLMGAVLMELSVGYERKTASMMTTGRAFELELISADGIDKKTLQTINKQVAKPELVFQWIQQLVVDASNKAVFSVAPPVLSRSFQELANGMVQYRRASKIARVPFPFPYVQATELLLVSHWLLTPPLMVLWTLSPLWTGILTFVQVTFFWSLNAIASELENPFGEDVNDLPAAEIQQDFNDRLLLLLHEDTRRLPQLTAAAIRDEIESPRDRTGGTKLDPSSFTSAPPESQINRRSSFGDLHTTIEKQYLSENDTPRTARHVSCTVTPESGAGIVLKRQRTDSSRRARDRKITWNAPSTFTLVVDVDDAPPEPALNSPSEEVPPPPPPPITIGKPALPAASSGEMLAILQVCEDVRTLLQMAELDIQLRKIADVLHKRCDECCRYDRYDPVAHGKILGKDLDAALRQVAQERVDRCSKPQLGRCTVLEACSSRELPENSFTRGTT
mmetsp:Transcript_56515/g.157504  ORF Transcript_56515/g.157504 Transcript_56515/m.157504 type:complete len:584 (+) Transcript_56515:74-1825(+)